MPTFRRALIFAVAGLAGGSVLALSPATAGGNPSLGVWYPHEEGACLGVCQTTSINFTLNRTKSEPDDQGTPNGNDGKGSTGPGAEVTFKSKAISADLPVGTKVSGTIYITSHEPEPDDSAQVTLQDLKAGGSTVAVGTGTTTSGSPALESWVPITFSFTTKKPIKAGDSIGFDIIWNDLLRTGMGFGSGHRSFLKLG